MRHYLILFFIFLSVVFYDTLQRAPNASINVDEMRGHYLSEESSPTSSYIGSPTSASPTLGFPGPSSSDAASAARSDTSPPAASAQQVPQSPPVIGYDFIFSCRAYAVGVTFAGLLRQRLL